MAALTREFEAYLRLCAPLASIERPLTRAGLVELFEGFRGADDVVVAELHGAVVCTRAGHGAIVGLPGDPPTVYRVDEPHLADALTGYIDNLPGKVATPEEVDAPIRGLAG